MGLTRGVFAVLGVLIGLVVVSTVISAILTALAVVWTLVTAAATLAILGALVYGAYRLYQWLAGDGTAGTDQFGSGYEPATTSSGPQPENRVERLQQRYADGELSEAELERRLERELETDEPDSIDRELERERL